MSPLTILCVYLAALGFLALYSFVVWFVRLHDRREAQAHCSIFGHNWCNIYGDGINSCGGYRAFCARCGARSKELR